MAHSLGKDSRKGSEASLALSNTPTEAGSIREMPPSNSSPRPSVDSSIEEPDWPRSWRAYACLLGCFFLMFNSWGLVNAYGTWSSYYIGHTLRNVDQLQLNLIGSTQSFLVLLLSNPIGRLLDAGLYRYVLAWGTIMVPLGLFILSVVHPDDVGATASFGTIWSLQGLVVGLGMAPFFVASSQSECLVLCDH